MEKNRTNAYFYAMPTEHDATGHVSRTFAGLQFSRLSLMGLAVNDLEIAKPRPLPSSPDTDVSDLRKIFVLLAMVDVA